MNKKFLAISMLMFASAGSLMAMKGEAKLTDNQNSATTKIQAKWRGNQARKEVNKVKAMQDSIAPENLLSVEKIYDSPDVTQGNNPLNSAVNKSPEFVDFDAYNRVLDFGNSAASAISNAGRSAYNRAVESLNFRSKPDNGQNGYIEMKEMNNLDTSNSNLPKSSVEIDSNGNSTQITSYANGRVENKYTRSNYQQAVDIGNTLASGAQRAASAVYNAPGRAVQAMGGNKDFISGDSYSLKRGLQILDRKASNTGAQLGIPNLTGRSRDIRNLDANTRQAYGQRFAKKDRRTNIDNGITNDTISNKDGSITTTVQNNKGETLVRTKNRDQIISEVYTPVNTYSNLPARTLRSMYNALPTLTTQQGRQEFKNNVSAMFKRSGQTEPSARSWSEFFNSTYYGMSMPEFSATFNKLMINLRLRSDNTQETNNAVQDLKQSFANEPVSLHTGTTVEPIIKNPNAENYSSFVQNPGSSPTSPTPLSPKYISADGWKKFETNSAIPLVPTEQQRISDFNVGVDGKINL